MPDTRANSEASKRPDSIAYGRREAIFTVNSFDSTANREQGEEEENGTNVTKLTFCSPDFIFLLQLVPPSLAVHAQGVVLLLVGAKCQLISFPGVLHPIVHINVARI